VVEGNAGDGLAGEHDGKSRQVMMRWVLSCVVERRAWDCSLVACGIEDGVINWSAAGICTPKHLGIWALPCARTRTLASVGLTPANGFSGQTASGFAGVAGVGGVNPGT
jgi:hypothetical protein